MANEAVIQDIIRKCGAVSDEYVNERASDWWDDLANSPSSTMQSLLFERQILEHLQGKYHDEVDTYTGPDRQMAAQVFKHVTEMLTRVQGRIDREATSLGLGVEQVKSGRPLNSGWNTPTWPSYVPEDAGGKRRRVL